MKKAIVAVLIVSTALNCYLVFINARHAKQLGEMAEALRQERFKEFQTGATCGLTAVLREIMYQQEHRPGQPINPNEFDKAKLFESCVEIRKEHFPELPMITEYGQRN